MYDSYGSLAVFVADDLHDLNWLRSGFAATNLKNCLRETAGEIPEMKSISEAFDFARREPGLFPGAHEGGLNRFDVVGIGTETCRGF